MFLYGASGHSKVIIDIVTAIGDEIVEGLYDDSPKYKEVLGFCVTSSKSVFEKESKWIITIGNNNLRKKISNQLEADFITVIHPEAVLSSSSKIGVGTVVMAGAVINAEAIIGKHSIINTSSVIEHDCVLGDFVHISPKAALAGNVQVGEGTHVGVGAVVIQGVKIGSWVTIGAGAVIIRDVPDFAVVVGSPGKIIKYNEF